MASPVSLSSELESRIAARTARIGIIGMGYVGLPLALLFSEQRFHVTGFDIDTTKVEALNSGGSYIVRIPAPEIVKAQSSGFPATSAYAEIAQMDAVIICVPTPLDEYHQPDLSYVEKTAQAIAPHLRQGQLVILESTTYPGTTEEISSPSSSPAIPPACAPSASPVSLRLPRRLLARARRSRQRHDCPPRYSQGHRRLSNPPPPRSPQPSTAASSIAPCRSRRPLRPR